MKPVWIWVVGAVVAGLIIASAISFSAHAGSPAPQYGKDAGYKIETPDGYADIWTKCLKNGDRLYISGSTETDYGEGASGIAVVPFTDSDCPNGVYAP